jgi:pimeloyl-ACP methyl ester carboxylesterase
MKVLCTLLALLPLASAGYDMVRGNSSVWLSSIAYCPPETYLTRAYVGAATGFVPTAHIQWAKDTTEGFVGYMKSQSLIYIAFRGSETIQNWVDNLDVLTTGYPACDSCEVHKGFNDVERAAFPQVLAAVQSLRAQFPSYGIVVTGHSLGAAIATLTALDLMQNGFSDVSTIHFGSPRVGNTAFADYATAKFGSDSARNTHHKDMVVHSPMHERFTHHAREYYEDPVLNLKVCSGNEDSECSYQWHWTSISDHMLYLNKEMGTDGCV